MTGERRYGEEEVERIFEEATRSGKRLPERRDSRAGLTLSELQEIGEEVGIPSAVVARAASRVDAGEAAKAERHFGFPLAVSRTVELPRAFTDEEWERLVADLRRTFDARGRVESSGGLRQWTNGNLHALVEPGPDGHRLRIETRKGSVRPILSVSFVAAMSALVLAMVAVVSGTPIEWSGVLVLGLLGVGAAGSTLARLPGWASTRARQMDEIAARAAEMTALPPGSGSDAGSDTDSDEGE